MRTPWLLLLLPLLTGCPWITQGDHDDRLAGLGTDDTGPSVTDADGDGYSSAVDCDDASAAVYPGADERCNGIDDDCDAQVDESDAIDASTFYADGDGDGYGHPGAPTQACEQPQDHSEDATDCDDRDAAVYPSADELCNDIDDDCDEEVDEDDALDAPSWYADSDGDGYGVIEDVVVTCEQPSGYAPEAGDCDEGDGAVHPGAAELCDEIDNDCDGETDESDATDAPTWYADGDGDGFGDPEASTLSCAQPSEHVADSGDCDDDDGAVHPDATEWCDGVDNDCDGETDESDAADVTTWYTDGDGDGYGDDSIAVEACDQPTGMVDSAIDQDCDDSDAGIHPGADELCDGADNDCDGSTDEPEALDATDWYTDADGDGFGDPATLERSCLAGSGQVSDDNDCDDSDAGIHPGADEHCDGVDEDCDGDIDEDDAVDVLTWYADSDVDSYGDASATDIDCNQPSGFVANSDDCDDRDAAIHPAADEVCDGADNDCDASVDEDEAVDVLTWFHDTDGDRYGDPSDTDIDCNQPSGFVANGDDCDDGDPAINPGATELCDLVDNNCDASIDGSDAADASTWYADGDGDGYGDPTASTASCSQPSGHVSDDSDCDDSDTSVHPGADEYCNGTDNDCDGSVDSPAALDAPTWYADSDGDGFGTSSGTTVACDQPSGFAASDDDCDDSDGSIHPGATEVWYDGLDQDCDGADDYDQDGDGDLHASHGGGDCDDTEPTVYSGADEIGLDGLDNDCSDGDSDTLTLDLAYASFEGDRDGDLMGWGLARAGDVNGDSIDDFWIGAPGESSDAGTAYLFHGPVSAGSLSGSDAALQLTGSTGYEAGWAIASGDVDTDGDPDVLIGAPGHNSDTGIAFLIHGPLSASAGVYGSASLLLTGDSSGDRAGLFVQISDDLDGDGYDDLMIGAPYDNYGGSEFGRAFVVSSRLTGTWDLPSIATISYRIRNTEAHMGRSMASGDFDADGNRDIVVGSPKAAVSGNYLGAAFLMYGPLATGEQDISNSDNYDVRMFGSSSQSQHGYSAVNIGDTNDDGYDDLAIGAPLDDVGGSQAGAAYVLFGDPADGRTSDRYSGAFFGGPSDNAGTSLAAPGDLNGDGYDDLVVGVPYETTTALEAGAAYVLLGPVSGSYSASSADGKIEGVNGSDLAGMRLGGPGDIDGDGMDDLLLGAPAADEDGEYGPGEAFILPGLSF
jgi:hypothetical protein